MFGEYKLAAYGIIAILLFGIGTTAVLSYNHYVAKAAEQAEQIKIRDQVINDQQAMVAEKIRQAELAKRYQTEADQRRIESDNRVKQILSMETKRDEKGNISGDDPVLYALNRMYPADPAGKGPADPAAGTAVPKVPAPAGDLARGKEVLPE